MLSILDTDLYVATMSYSWWKQYPLAEGTYKFNDRSKEVYDEEFLKQLKLELAKLSTLKLTEEEFNWAVKNIPWIPENYWEWLKGFRLNPHLLNVWLDEEGHLQAEVTDKMYKACWYEMPVLATVAELRNKYRGFIANREIALKILEDKINFANENNLRFSEFGTRRRYSESLHEDIVRILKEKCPVNCTGTSNMYLAMRYDMKPIGTMAHAYIQFHAGCFGYKRANYLALEAWIATYGGNLGTALVDTYTTESFLRTLTYQQALLLQGFRVDSGDEFKIGNMIIKRLQDLRIDPTTKVLIFSNALTFPKFKEIRDYFGNRIKLSGAGIGTNITCDPGIEGYKPANIVMKLSKCRMSSKDPWEEVIKISDDLGKHIGNQEQFDIATKELHLKI